jgi:NAD-dependent dihydropyrimidine dehydrogenase PreA subunit
MLREIVVIDENLCNGCGDCIPACAEGALRIVNGKAKLVADRLCDGMAACLGHCPTGAIRIERREADAFDEVAVMGLKAALADGHAVPSDQFLASGLKHAPAHACPGSRSAQIRTLPTLPGDPPPRSREPSAPSAGSELSTWPVKLRLVSPRAPFLANARVLLAADCVPVAVANFQELIRGRVAVIACPKFESPEEQLERLTALLTGNDVRELMVLRMQVPCCGGIVSAAREACTRAGFRGTLVERTISLEGEMIAEKRLDFGAA